MSKPFKLDDNKSVLGNIADKVNNIEAKDSFNLRMIDIDKLIPSDKNIYGMRDIEELAADIKENGLYHNLVVKPTNGKYEILSGERRYRALVQLGETKIPCKVLNENIDDVDSEIILIQANAKARELNDSEKRKQVERLEELLKIKKSNGDNIKGKLKENIADTMGISPAQTQRYMTINHKLIPELKELLDNNKITMTKAFDFAKLDEEMQKNMYEFLKDNIDASNDTIEALKREIKDKEESAERNKTKAQQTEEDLKKIKQELDDRYKDTEKIREELRNEIEDELKNKSEEDPKVKELQEKLKKANEESEHAKQKIESLNLEIEELSKSNKDKSQIDKESVMANIEVVALAKEAQRVLSTISAKIGMIGTKKMQLTDETLKTLDDLVQRSKDIYPK